MLEGFRRLPSLSGTSFISVTKNGINFNANVVFHMDKSEYVIVLLNETKKQLAVQKCDKDDEDAFPFCRKVSNWKNGVRLNNREMQQIIVKIMNWDLENFTYRVTGFFNDEENAMIFDFNNAKRFNRRRQKDEDN